MTDHIDTSLLERTILAPDALGKEELARIRDHLHGCALCREHMESLERMYRIVEGELNEPPSEQDRQAAARILPRGLERNTPKDRLIEAYADVVAPYNRPIRRSLMRLIKAHPYQSGGAFLVVGGALALLFTLFMPTKDQNPTYAEIKNYVLSAYNKEAEVIWKRGVPGLPDWTSTSLPDPARNYPYRLLSVANIDGKNLNEVLLVGSSPRGEFTNDTLYCFDGNGTLRWKTGTGPMISFGRTENQHHNRPQIVDFLVMRRSQGIRPQIFILANEQVYSPTKLFEVSAKDGTILQSYFNRGGCTSLLHRDVDLDGNEELLVGGVNDGFNRACLAVLDPACLRGYSPVPTNEMPTGGNGGSEMYYILFPRWKLGNQSGHELYNLIGRLIEPQGGGIDVTITEVLIDPENLKSITGSLFFSLGPTLSVGRIMADDSVIRMGKSLYQQGKISAPITNSTYSTLKDSLLYWDGDRFVNTPTMNKHYKTPAGTPPAP